MGAGNLNDVISGKYKGLPVGDNKEILLQITSGLEHLHKIGIIHGDLKPANILISYPSGTVAPLIKLSDFGIIHVVQRDQTDLSESQIERSIHDWMSPEVINGVQEEITDKIDIFPLGCIFCFTLSGGRHPFGENKDDRIRRISNNEPMILTIEELNGDKIVYQLIKSMLNPEPSRRPSASTILKDTYFASSPLPVSYK